MTILSLPSISDISAISETQRNTFSSVLMQMGQQALVDLSLTNFFRESASQVAKVLGVQHFSLWQIHSDGHSLEQIVHYDVENIEFSLTDSIVTDNNIYRLLADREASIRSDPDDALTIANKLPIPAPDTSFKRFNVLVPGKDRPLGLIAVHANRLRNFSEEEIQFLQSVAHIFSMAIERQQAERLIQLQRQILEQIALGDALPKIFNNLCILIEEQLPGAYCSIMTVDPTGQSLKAEAGPSLPPGYAAGVDGLLIGHCSGSCGTAAYRGESVFVTDIGTDPLWAPFKDFALSHGIQACWSMPFTAQNQTVLGTFAISHRFPCQPTAYHQQILTMATHLATISIEAYRSAQMLLQANQHLEARILERTQDLQLALENLKKTQAQLVQAEKMSSLGQMMAGIAHEVNNPVGFIKGNLGHVADYTTDLMKVIEGYQALCPAGEPAVEAIAQSVDLDYIKTDFPNLLKSMETGVDRIDTIVKGLRNFSRLDEAAQKAVNLHDGLDNTLMILNHRLRESKHLAAVQVVKQYGVLPPITCYANQLNQVFMNILTNAIDALDERRKCYRLDSTAPMPEIVIRTEMVENQVQIAIADNGTGIDAAIQSRIFDPFFTTKPVGKGTGLGMSTSYQIISETHNGSIRVESVPEEGAEFIMQLPVSA